MTTTLANESPVTVEMNGPIWLKVRMDVPTQSPEELLRWFTTPDLLARWMGDEHEIDLVPGGRYTIHFSSARLSMIGEVIVARPTELLFSWSFDHEPEKAARIVMVQAMRNPESDKGVCALTIIHGPYRDDMRFATASHEDEERAGHLEGWQYFLPRLREQLLLDA